MKLKKWLQTNSLFLRVISVAVAGVILATILITWISIQTLQKNYLKTFRNANQIFTEQINTDMTEFYAETATVMQPAVFWHVRYVYTRSIVYYL